MLKCMENAHEIKEIAKNDENLIRHKHSVLTKIIFSVLQNQNDQNELIFFLGVVFAPVRSR